MDQPVAQHSAFWECHQRERRLIRGLRRWVPASQWEPDYSRRGCRWSGRRAAVHRTHTGDVLKERGGEGAFWSWDIGRHDSGTVLDSCSSSRRAGGNWGGGLAIFAKILRTRRCRCMLTVGCVMTKSSLLVQSRSVSRRYTFNPVTCEVQGFGLPLRLRASPTSPKIRARRENPKLT